MSSLSICLRYTGKLTFLRLPQMVWHKLDCELRLVEDEEEEPYHPDYDMSAFQRMALVGALKSEELAICKIKNKIIQTYSQASLQSSNDLASTLSIKGSTIKFKVYATMLNLCEYVEVNSDSKLIDVARQFIRQADNQFLNKIEGTDSVRNKDNAKLKRKNTIEEMLTLSLHIEGRQSKSVLKYEDYAMILDYTTCVRHIKSTELDLSYKMYGDAHYSLDGNFTTLSPIFVNKNKDFGRESTITSEIKEESISANEEALSSITRMSMLSHYKVWETSYSGIKHERVLGVDRYGIYLYYQEWVHYNDKHRLESESKLVVCLSSIIIVEACKMNTCKFYVYYVDKSKMKEDRLFLEAATSKIAKEILTKVRLLMASPEKA